MERVISPPVSRYIYRKELQKLAAYLQRQPVSSIMG